MAINDPYAALCSRANLKGRNLAAVGDVLDQGVDVDLERFTLGAQVETWLFMKVFAPSLAPGSLLSTP